MFAVNASPQILEWSVAHTRPRCEKRVVDWAQREGILTTLPLYKSVKRYRGKTVTFLKPLFPGYVFLRSEAPLLPKIRQNQHVANLLAIPDQQEFEHQLSDILIALETELEVRLAPQIDKGSKVRIKSGPLRGMEAWVQERTGTVEAILRLDFIGQAAAVMVNADDLELV